MTLSSFFGGFRFICRGTIIFCGKEVKMERLDLDLDAMARAWGIVPSSIAKSTDRSLQSSVSRGSLRAEGVVRYNLGSKEPPPRSMRDTRFIRGGKPVQSLTAEDFQEAAK
jgi:hypothetical protein